MSEQFPGHEYRIDQNVDEPKVQVGQTAHAPWYSRVFVGSAYERNPMRTVAMVAVAVFALGSIGTYSVVSGDAIKSFSNAVFAAKVKAVTYTWNLAGYDGGGRGNAVAMDPNNSGSAALGGDVWGPHTTMNQGNLWTPRMSGLNGIGDVYVRAVAFSKKHPGTTYWGVGTLTGLGGSYNGFFGSETKGSFTMTKMSTTVGFASSQAAGSAGLTPRAVGRLIAVDYDTKSGTEYIYALTSRGLARSTNGGASFLILGLSSVPNMAWKAVDVAPDGSLYIADYGTRSSDTAVTGQQLWHVTNPRAASPTITDITASSKLPAPVNDFATINGSVWAASATGLYELVGSTWQPVGASFFGATPGLVISSIDGAGKTVYVGMGDAPSGDFIAKSTDGGTTWNFVTQAASIQSTVQGTTRTWWLAAHGLPSSYGVEQLAVDPNNPNFVISSGFRGAYATTDGGATWYPSDNGLDGSEVSHILVGASGQAWNDDTDWAQPTGAPWKTIATTDFYSSVQGSQTTVTFPTPALSRTVNGHTYALVKGRPYNITMDGRSVSTQYFQGALTNPTDIEISPEGYIYIAQFGGGVLVGTPH
jgi:hypothetical protein